MHSNTYYELIDAMREERGCPVCFLLDRYISRYIDNLLYENVNNKDIRDKILTSRGFCREHSKRILEYRYKGYALGIAIIYKDLIESYLEGLNNGRITPGRCFICEVSDDMESRLLDEIIKGIKEYDFYEVYRNSYGLCISHLSKIVNSVRDKEIRNIFLEIEVSKLKALSEDLSEFIRRQDYRFKEESMEEKSNGWIRAIDILNVG